VACWPLRIACHARPFVSASDGGRRRRVSSVALETDPDSLLDATTATSTPQMHHTRVVCLFHFPLETHLFTSRHTLFLPHDRLHSLLPLSSPLNVPVSVFCFPYFFRLRVSCARLNRLTVRFLAYTNAPIVCFFYFSGHTDVFVTPFDNYSNGIEVLDSDPPHC